MSLRQEQQNTSDCQVNMIAQKQTYIEAEVAAVVDEAEDSISSQEDDLQQGEQEPLEQPLNDAVIHDESSEELFVGDSDGDNDVNHDDE